MQKVKRSNSISTNAVGLTDARRWLFVLEMNVCGVGSDWLGGDEEESASFEGEGVWEAELVASAWPCSIVAGLVGSISRCVSR